MDRRQFLRLTGAGAAVTLAGCGGGDGGTEPTVSTTTESSSETSADPPMTTEPTTTSESTIRTPTNSVPDLSHPSATDLAAQPTRGEFTGKVIVAFEDPSCTTCRRFHRDVFPRIESNLLEPGKVAYVFRNYPVIYPWGEPASKALEATFERDVATGWQLIDHYFAAQSSFDTNNVLAKTETYLNDQTTVDGSAVVTAVENGDADAAVQADLDAGSDGGLGRVTPTFALFRNNEYQTRVRGSVSYNTFETILGV